MPTTNQAFEYGDNENSDINASKNVMQFYKNYQDENSQGIKTQADVIKIDMDTFENHIINIDNNLDEIIHYITSSKGETSSIGAGIRNRMIGGASKINVFHELEGPRYYDDLVDGRAYMPNSGLYGGALYGGALNLGVKGDEDTIDFINGLDKAGLIDFVSDTLPNFFKLPIDTDTIDYINNKAVSVDDARAQVIEDWEELLKGTTPGPAGAEEEKEELEVDPIEALEDALLPSVNLGSSILQQKPSKRLLNSKKGDDLREIAEQIIGSDVDYYSEYDSLGSEEEQRTLLMELWKTKYSDIQKEKKKASKFPEPPADADEILDDISRIDEELKSAYYNEERLRNLFIALNISGPVPKGKKIIRAKIIAHLYSVADPMKTFIAAKRERYEYNPILQTITKINISIDKAVSYLKSTFLRDAQHLTIDQIDDLVDIMSQIVAKQKIINKAITNSLLFDPATVNALHNMSKKLDAIVEYIRIATGNKKFDISPGEAIMQDILVEPPPVEYETAFEKLDKKIAKEKIAKEKRAAKKISRQFTLALEAKRRDEKARTTARGKAVAAMAAEKARAKTEGAGLRGRRKLKGGNIKVLPSKYSPEQQKIITKYLL